MTHRDGSPGHFGRALVSLALVGMFVALAPAAAAATTDTEQAAQATATTYQPDGRIRDACHPELTDCVPTWYGNDIYNTTAEQQRVVWYDCCGFEEGPAVFRISIQNDGTASDRFRVAASGLTDGYKVRFFRGTTDITPSVKAGTYRTPLLAPGEKHLIKVRVTADDACCDDKTNRLVTLTSVGDPTKKDAVKLVRRYLVCGC